MSGAGRNNGVNVTTEVFKECELIDWQGRAGRDRPRTAIGVEHARNFVSAM